MNDRDIIHAKKEALKFIQFVDVWIKAEEERGKCTWATWNCPVEIGLIRAQSIILSRALSAMRNPYCKRNERKRK